MKSLEDIQKKLLKECVILSYQGKFSHKVLIAASKLIEAELESLQETLFMKKRVVHLVIEMLENIIKYHTVPPKKTIAKKFPPIFLFGKETDTYFMCSGNIITNDQSKYLTKFLTLLNRLDDQYLQRFYKSAIRAIMLGEKKGKMGFLEMILKSKNKINFEIKEINKDYSYFTYILSVKVTTLS